MNIWKISWNPKCLNSRNFGLRAYIMPPIVYITPPIASQIRAKGGMLLKKGIAPKEIHPMPIYIRVERTLGQLNQSILNIIPKIVSIIIREVIKILALPWSPIRQ